MKAKKLISMGLAAAMTFSMLATTGCGSSSGDDAESFSVWIYSTDGAGTYYEDYEDNPEIQWLNQQYWDTENGGLTTEDSGTNIQFSFLAPITGSESDNFSTMIGTGEYTDIIDMAVSSDNAETMVNNGIAMDLTEYVEQYMPNYVAFLAENPDVEPLVTVKDDEGNTHYYALYQIKDGTDVPWGGYVYRRDWVVKYATPTEYVWDWDSDYVKENGHPAVTPLAAAQEAGDLTGWKVNEVTSFTSSEGDDPDNDYEDNVIFPSGLDYPYTISDWEWMFEAFQKAIDERGYTDNTDAYCTTVYYPGFLGTGDLVSSFGGGTGSTSQDEDHNIYFSGVSENFKTYLECVHNWYEKGWLDTKFETRASDIFFQINQNGTAQGMVGLWYSTIANVGDTIRVTCQDESDQQDAYVMACACPVNDVYGTEDNMYKIPDSFYQGSRLSGSICITEAAADKDLAALFTCLDWFYTREGSLTKSWGLSKEQLEATPIDNDLYAEYGCDYAYDITQGEDGKEDIVIRYDTSSDLSNALKICRVPAGIEMTGAGANLDYTLDRGNTKVVTDALATFSKYTSTGGVTDLNSQFSEEQNEIYSKYSTSISDYMNQTVPTLVKDGLDGWDAYVEKFDSLHVDDINQIYQEVVDKLYK
jgi:hypothetical protein